MRRHAASALPGPAPAQRHDWQTVHTLFPYIWAYRGRVLFALACLFTGLAFGPLITALSLQLGALAPSASVTEAFTWSTTLLMLGLGAGMWLGGVLAQQWGWSAALLGAAAAMALAALFSPCVPAVRAD